MSSAKQNTTERPPIVAVLGHVDHGKSTLLDFIRKSNTVAGEAGGITQKVAAYEVAHKGKRITFIDTPGHAAFSAIRARGASVADIAILVVAADDGPKAQTLEALQSIRESGTPFIVAINKIDKPTADLSRTQAALLEEGVYLEKLGGDVPWVALSAKSGQGVGELLDLILLVAEIEGFTGVPDVPAKGYILEAHRDQKRGLAATLVITDGVLESGMTVLAGRAISPVRIMENASGESLREATFSTPVSLVGFDELPEAGAEFRAFETKKEAEAVRPQAPRAANPDRTDLSENEGGPYIMPVIIRADSTGSLEAIAHELATIGDEYSRVEIVQSGIGAVSENDVKTALAGKLPARIIAFNVGTDPLAQSQAIQREVRIESFDIIYRLTEHVRDLLESSRPKRRVEEITGRARVLKTFSSRKDECVIGGKVIEGYLACKARVRVLRRGEIMAEGAITNIQTNKQDVDRVEKDREFGARIAVELEIAPGDVLENYVTVMK